MMDEVTLDTVTAPAYENQMAMIPAIPVQSLPPSVLDETQRRLTPWLRVQGKPVSRCGVSVDPQRLSAMQQWLLDDGALLPEWAYYWLTLGAELLRIDQNRNMGSVLIYPSTKSPTVVLLETTEIATALGSAAFRQEAGVILAWGIAPQLMAEVSKPAWPLPCLGAVASTVDGLGMACIADPAELPHLTPWMTAP